MQLSIPAWEISPYWTVLPLIFTFLIVAVVRSRSAGLEKIPGPFISRYTQALRGYMAIKYSGRDVNLYMKLHEKYGDVVRIGPRSVSVLDPAAVQTIYNVKGRLSKGPNVLPFNVPGVPTSILAILDEKTHSRYRRPIQHAYSLTSLKGFEPYVDDTINTLSSVIDRHVAEKKPINISNWLYYWSYDTVGKITFGQTTGYLDKGTDFNGLIKRQKQFLEYVSVVSNWTSLDAWLAKNPIFKLIPHGTFDFIRFAQVRVDDRISKYDPEDKERPDLLSYFVAARDIFPEVVTDEQVLVYGVTNVIAGSLSTSHVMDEIVRYLTCNPEAQQRIFDELESPDAGRNEPVSFDVARKSAYLEAVIQEGYRIHSVANLSLEREVSSEGMTLPSGHYLPPGTLVGINAAAMNRRVDVFGPNTELFDPLRWLPNDGEREEDFTERRLRMDRANLTFGQGSRSCLGKNVVQLEAFKVIASLAARYKFELLGEPTLFNVNALVKLRE